MVQGRSRVIGFGMALLLGLSLAACGDDPDPSPEELGDAGAQEQAQEEDGNPELYCELVEELDEAGDEIFEELEKDENATNKDYKEAERNFVEEHQSTLDELVEAGPAEIKDDVRTIVASVKDRAGLGPKVAMKEVVPAEKRVQRWEKENC